MRGKQRYVVALGSNQRHHRFGAPEKALGAALDRLRTEGLEIIAASRAIRSMPIGPSRRRYANAAVLISCDFRPDDLLEKLKDVEREFGRKSRGERWRARVLDLDIILWSGGLWKSPGLAVPHAAFRDRAFVLSPVTAIAPRWRDPLSGLSMRHLLARLHRPQPKQDRGCKD